jgi:hypothetical protein
MKLAEEFQVLNTLLVTPQPRILNAVRKMLVDIKRSMKAKRIAQESPQSNLSLISHLCGLIFLLHSYFSADTASSHVILEEMWDAAWYKGSQSVRN